jgi:hypothetical protein
VLGERGRAHVFNAQGKLVTSLRAAPANIEKRRERGLWRPATPAEVGAVRGALAAERQSRDGRDDGAAGNPAGAKPSPTEPAGGA